MSSSMVLLGSTGSDLGGGGGGGDTECRRERMRAIADWSLMRMAVLSGSPDADAPPLVFMALMTDIFVSAALPVLGARNMAIPLGEKVLTAENGVSAALSGDKPSIHTLPPVDKPVFGTDAEFANAAAATARAPLITAACCTLRTPAPPFAVAESIAIVDGRK
jgi:hypothetical protein